MGQHRPLFRLFFSFQSHTTIFTTNQCEKCPSSIQCQDSNSRHLEHGSLPRTTRPGLPPSSTNPYPTSMTTESKGWCSTNFLSIGQVHVAICSCETICFGTSCCCGTWCLRSIEEDLHGAVIDGAFAHRFKAVARNNSILGLVTFDLRCSERERENAKEK